MKCPRSLAVLSVLAVNASTGHAAPQPTAWSTYERASQPDGVSAGCFKHRRGARTAGDVRWYVFQIFNDCNRRMQAVCDIAYTSTCAYDRDVAVAAHLDAPIEPFGESPAFGHFRPTATGSVPGCFFARCSEAAP